MKNLFKKLSVGMLAVVMVAIACVSVFAAADMTNMVFAGYDTTNPFKPDKVYYEVIDGKYTGKTFLENVADSDIAWEREGYEAAFPHAGYSRMYIEGNKTVYTAYNGLFPQWETRRQDYYWELTAPYTIWERQQTKIENDHWEWDYGNEKFGIYDASLLFKTARKANVLSTEYIPYGIGIYSADGTRTLTTEVTTKRTSKVSETALYAKFDEIKAGYYANLPDDPTQVDGWKLWGASAVGKFYKYENTYTEKKDLWKNWKNWNAGTDIIAAKVANGTWDVYGNFSVSDAEIQQYFPVIYSKQVTAKFNDVDDEGLLTKHYATEYMDYVNKRLSGWDWDKDNLIVRYDAKIEWTAPQYELDEPYRYYQFLVVNGIVMDGHKVMNGDNLLKGDTEKIERVPYITRYTGGYATPVITWKFDHFEPTSDSTLFEVVLRKFVDGQKTEIFRKPTGEYGKVYFKISDYAIKVMIDDNNGNVVEYATIPQGNPNNLGGVGIDVPMPYNYGTITVPASVVKY